MSPTLNTAGPSCVLFWYHMYGADVNRLSVYIKLAGRLGQAVWSKTGTQGDRWLYAQIETGSFTNTQVVFEALKGRSYQGDIALDDITITNGPCPAPSMSVNDITNKQIKHNTDKWLGFATLLNYQASLSQ